jgi:hypothetical protein
VLSCTGRKAVGKNASITVGYKRNIFIVLFYSLWGFMKAEGFSILKGKKTEYCLNYFICLRSREDFF